MLSVTVLLAALSLSPTLIAAEPPPTPKKAPPPTKTVMVLKAQIAIPDTWTRASGDEADKQARWKWPGMGSFVMTLGDSGPVDLKAFVTGLKKSFQVKGHKVLEERETTMDGQPAIALDVVMTTKIGDMTVEAQQRIYCVNSKRRFYTLIFATEKKRWQDAAVRRIARTFRAL